MTEQRTKVFISEADQYLFSQATHYDIYKKLGAHVSEEEGVEGIYFGVWAPNARAVHVIGSFNGWDKEAPPMEPIVSGIWERFIPGVQTYDEYKFYIERPDGSFVFRADPYATHAATRPENASKVFGYLGTVYSRGEDRGNVQIPHHGRGRQKALQGGSLCQLRGVQTGDGFHYHRPGGL